MSELVVFSDLDGTLLDSRDYAFEPARPALAELRRRGSPLVLCSGKTNAELTPLAVRLGLAFPFVVENGGAIVLPAGARAPWPPDGRPRRGPLVLARGVPRRRLVASLPGVARAAGVEVRGFSAMSVDEVAALTGLSAGQAALALQRGFDEPFLVLEPGSRDPAHARRLDAAARRLGLRVEHGGRLYHLKGPADKGDAVRELLRLQGGDDVLSVALGDAASDRAMLEAVRRPILVPGPAGLDPALAAALPRAERAPLPGPAGWNAAVLAVLHGTTLPRVAA